MLYVPVIDALGKPLMPCHPARARELVKKGKVIRRFNRGIFYIQVLHTMYGKTQKVVVGVDPGSKKEGFTVKSAKHTFLNIQADAVTWVQDSVKRRREARKARRSRNTPCRKNKANRTYGGLAPSIRVRWNWKLRICKWLQKLYPITIFVVEDVKANPKSFPQWGTLFGCIEIGKNWFYKELAKLGKVELLCGYQTKEKRDLLGLNKSKNKLSDKFSAHCVDSWVLANFATGGHLKPDNEILLKLIPLRFYRRQLHVFNFAKGGKRKLFGGTRSLNLKKGSVVKHPVLGLTTVGGKSIVNNTISLHSISTGKRLVQNAKVDDCKFFSFSSWRWQLLSVSLGYMAIFVHVF